MIHSATVKQYYKTASLMPKQEGNQNEGILIAKPPDRSPLLFKVPKINTSRSIEMALQEGKHHQDVYETLSEHTKQLIPKYYSHFFDDDKKRAILSMSYIDAPSLSSLYKSNQISQKQVWHYYKKEVVPVLDTLLQDGFYHADPNIGNILRTAEGSKLVDMDKDRTFLFLKYPTHLSRLLKLRRSVALHINKKELLKSESPTYIKKELKRLMLADLKRAFVQYATFTPTEKDSKFIKNLKVSVHKWLKLPHHRPFLEAFNVLVTYQPFFNFDDKTLLQRLKTTFNSYRAKGSS
ncbi:MAG: AarF/UbiB family protein [Vampirovibrionales bacterium]